MSKDSLVLRTSLVATVILSQSVPPTPAQNCNFLGSQMVNPFYIVTICSDYYFLKHISFLKESKGF